MRDFIILQKIGDGAYSEVLKEVKDESLPWGRVFNNNNNDDDDGGL